MDELVIKVPAPFSGIEDLGFSARYPMQPWNERLRDVPFIIEGPASPMRVLVERLELFTEKERLVPSDDDDEAYTWTAPVRLTDEVCVLAFRDRSLDRNDRTSPTATLSTTDDTASRSYVWNLVRPLAFTFLRDCVRIGGLRLADQIEFVVDAGRPPVVDLEMSLASITPRNGSRLLFTG